MARQASAQQSSGHTVLLVDDDLDYLEVHRRLLEREGHKVFCAPGGPEALAVLRREPIDLVLLDYFMPGMTGEEVVLQMREFNRFVQVILQTGYATERPPREMLRRLDIQGYYDKSEGPEKLLLWTDVGLKAAYTVQLLYKSREGLRYILDATPELHKIQPLEDLLRGALWQVAGLLGAMNSFLAVLPSGAVSRPPATTPEGFVALRGEEIDLVIRAGTGRFAASTKIDGSLSAPALEQVRRAFAQGQIEVYGESSVVPLRVGELTIGVLYLDRPPLDERDKELLLLFANQAAVAIHNAELYVLATLDRLTGVQVRGFFDDMLLREMRSAFRTRQPLSLLMVDMDGLKQVNDRYGHLTGDQALALMGKVLRQATRTTDIVGRYGGDEFAVALPQASAEDAAREAQRILTGFEGKVVAGPDGHLPVRACIGLATLAPFAVHETPALSANAPTYFRDMVRVLVERADSGLYQAKANRQQRLGLGGAVTWKDLTPSSGS